MTPRNFIIFPHIEKNAGSTLSYILHQNFPFYVGLDSEPKRGNAKAFDEHALEGLLRITKYKIQGIGGHTIHPYFDYGSKLPTNLQSFYLTFVREPISRWLSHLNYRIAVMKQNWDIQRFLETEEFSNFQTKKLCGQPNAELAISILKKFSLVGILERFDEGLLLLKDKLGDDFNINYQRINVSSNKRNNLNIHNLTSEELALIRAANEEDIKLYEYVTDVLYSIQLQSYSGNIKEDLRKFNDSNNNYRFPYRKHISLKAKNQLVKFIIQPLSLKHS